MTILLGRGRFPLLVAMPNRKANGQACACTVELVALHRTLADLYDVRSPLAAIIASLVDFERLRNKAAGESLSTLNTK